MDLKKGIILCAGYGKRVLPLTKTTPKPLLKINEVPLIEYSIRILIELGVREIAVNVHHLKDKIIDYLKSNYPQIKIFTEEIILDTGGALVNAKNFLSDDYFIVLNSDTVWQKNYIPCMKSLIHKTINNNFYAGLDVFNPEPPSSDNELFKLNNTILTPHSAAYTDECLAEMSLHCAINIENFFKGKIDQSRLINKEIYS